MRVVMPMWQQSQVRGVNTLSTILLLVTVAALKT